MLLGKECLVAQSIKIGNVNSTAQCSCLELIREDAAPRYRYDGPSGLSKLLFSLVPMDMDENWSL